MIENKLGLINRLKPALALDLPYPERISLKRKASVEASVLILFAPHLDTSGKKCDFNILYTKRSELVESHRGQIAFPGGKAEEIDLGSSQKTALRETEEEVGIPASSVEIIGHLPSLVTVTGFQVSPVIGIVDTPISEIVFQLDPNEIAETIWVPLSVLCAPGTYRRENLSVGHLQYPIDVFQVNEYRIWGATGSMTKNLIDRLNLLR